jgi:LysR family transcriptional regulator, glycine cleavage system transcriptional activator
VLVLPLALRPHASPTVLRRQGVRRARGGWSRADLARVLTREPLIRHTTVPEGWDGWLAAARLQDEVQAARGPQYDLLSMALNGAIAGLGVALLPAYVVGAALRSGQLVALSPIEWSSQKGYWLRCPHAKAGLAALRSFREWLPRASLAA